MMTALFVTTAFRAFEMMQKLPQDTAIQTPNQVADDGSQDAVTMGDGQTKAGDSGGIGAPAAAATEVRVLSL